MLDRLTKDKRREWSAGVAWFGGIMTAFYLFWLFGAVSLAEGSLTAFIEDFGLAFLGLTLFGPFTLAAAAALYPDPLSEFLPPSDGYIWRFDLDDLGFMVVLSTIGAWLAIENELNPALSFLYVLFIFIAGEWIIWFLDGGLADQDEGEYRFNDDDFD